MPSQSNNLEALLLANGSNQSQLAEELGIDRANVSRWITGERHITDAQVENICEALSCTKAQLLLGHLEPANEPHNEPA